MITKTFEYKWQMINYYNKVIANKKVAMCFRGFSVEKGCYYVSYKF